MWPLRLTVICLAIWSVSGYGEKRQMTVKVKNTRLRVEWIVDWDRQEIEMDIRTSRRAEWILVGFSDHGKVEGSDVCVYTGGQWILDAHLLSDGRIERDRQQDCRLIKANPKTRHFRFKRTFSTCDPRDFAIEFGTTNFIFAVGHSARLTLRPPHSDHTLRYASLLDPVVPSPPLPSPEHSFTIDITARNVEIPEDTTTYWCQVMRLDERLIAEKHHAIRFEAVVTAGNEHLVHHMELFHCRHDPKVEYGGLCNSPMKPKRTRGCSKVLGAWAMGADPIVYPPEAGMPIGGEDFIPYLMVEIHYNNEHNEVGAHDSSGFRITYTDQLRPNDAAIMELGLIYSDANSIPPKQRSFPITGHCVSECTEKFGADGVHIFATQLHAHLTGRKLMTSHLRNGVKIGEINRDDHYSPHWQVIRSLPQHVHVLPGDVLSTTCVYDTTERKNWTWGGYEIENEMCVNYVYYYPATDVEVCKSAISNKTLNSFFDKYLGKTSRGLLIHQKYSKLKQTQRMYDTLREWYSTEPLNMACLNHAGELFANHPTKWQSVEQPRVFAGVYERHRADSECPAIND